MSENEKDRIISVGINRTAKGKIPRDAPKNAWAEFHRGWQYEQMTARDLAANVYRGFSFAPVFDGRKNRAHFTEAWHIALDFDCGDERASLEILQADDFIDYFCSFAYYTPSSKPHAYRSRVVFILDQPFTNADDYEAALSALAWWFPDSDQSTTDAARFFYGSQGAQVWTNWSILPRPSLDYVVEEWRKSSPPAQPIAARPVVATSDTEQQVADALRTIPRKLSYKEWLTVLMAVHSTFPDSRGVSLCESWSPGYEGEVEDKFKSFDRNRANGVTLATLFKMAQNYGYRQTKQQGNGQGQQQRKANGRGYTTRDLRDIL